MAASSPWRPSPPRLTLRSGSQVIFSHDFVTCGLNSRLRDSDPQAAVPSGAILEINSRRSFTELDGIRFRGGGSADGKFVPRPAGCWPTGSNFSGPRVVRAEGAANGAVRRSLALAPGIQKTAEPPSTQHSSVRRNTKTSGEEQGRSKGASSAPDRGADGNSAGQRKSDSFAQVRRQLRDSSWGGATGDDDRTTDVGQDEVSDRMRETFRQQRSQGMEAVRKNAERGRVEGGAEGLEGGVDEVDEDQEERGGDGIIAEIRRNLGGRGGLGGALTGVDMATRVDFSVDPEDLESGEYVVHKEKGICRFMGIKKEVPEGKSKEVKFVILKFADAVAKLRVKQAGKALYRYRMPGEVGKAPTLSKLRDSTQWTEKKVKGRRQIRRMVIDMMEVHVQRLKKTRPRYTHSPQAMADFAEYFPHKPTPDQEAAFKHVDSDMCDRDIPMDRLICGDVGFGKTEVAMRAVFQALLDGRQVMVLAPTTVLAKQHFSLMAARLRDYADVSVALLSRFQKEAQKRAVYAGIREGSLHVVVGTHALLGKQVQYHNLGLLIVDEEQRFGVKQKEQIRSLRTAVDVLTLSATPIPRTLYMALNGFRDASLINTPPPERKPIRTHVGVQKQEPIFAAIQFELDRNGQVFYVVPRVAEGGVAGIQVKLERLRKRFPEVAFDVAHGQQSSDLLEEAMEKFGGGETAVLLCTTIIESGLDIRRVNTIIIEDTQLFGLAQLYQLRIAAMVEFQGLGQGFQVAERDMGIRGVGSIFGEQQSGDVVKLGMDLYLEELHNALAQVDQQKIPEVRFEEVQVDIEVDCHVPSEFITSVEERERFVREGEEAAGMGMRELVDFGDGIKEGVRNEFPSIEMFLKSLYVRRIAADLGIRHISTRERQHVLFATEMKVAVFEMLRDSVEDERLRESLVLKQGRIEMVGLIELAPDRLMERVVRCLSDLRSGLPSFVKYI